MSLSDPIGDMLARIKNSQLRNHKNLVLPSSKFKSRIAEILKSEGYIIDYEVKTEEKKSNLYINLKYNSGNPVINSLKGSLNQVEEYFQAQKAYQRLIMDLALQLCQHPKVL